MDWCFPCQQSLFAWLNVLTFRNRSVYCPASDMSDQACYRAMHLSDWSYRDDNNQRQRNTDVRNLCAEQRQRAV